MGTNAHAALAARMVEALRARGAVTEVQLAAAAQHFAAGRLPSTALRLAGVAPDVVLAVLAVASGMPPAPPPTRWAAGAFHLTPINSTSWLRARAVPFAVVDGRVHVAFADPVLAASARDSLPAHVPYCCLEEDLDLALQSLEVGATMLPTPAPGGGAPSAPFDGDRTEAYTPSRATTLDDGAPAVDPRPPAFSAPRAQARPGVTELAATTIGQWTIDGELARGGMGVVYLAHDERGRRAALKLVHAHLLHLPEVRERFLREARATQRLRHKNIVAVLDVGEGDPAYLAVELVDRGSLHDLLRVQKRLPLPAALDVFYQMLEGLHAAHSEHIIHRDLKPSNLLLSSDGTLKLADFGVARELDATALTETGSTLGTPAYMSPEQVRAEKIDGRSDLYTAGVILYELVTGVKPFEADSIGAIVARVLDGRAVPLLEVDATVPEAVDDLVALMMRMDRDLRPPDAATVVAWLRPLIEESRRQYPRLLAELLRDPAAAERVRTAQADELVVAARSLLQSGPAGREPAALQLYRACLLAPEHEQAVRMLDGLSQTQGISFAAPKNPKLAEVERELVSRPDDPVLQQRAGQLWRQEGNVYRAMVHWRRYLRLRPDDAYTQAQLARLTAPPAAGTMKLATAQLLAPSPGAAARTGTIERIAGHIATGGLAAAAPVAPPAPNQLRVVGAGAPMPAPTEIASSVGEQFRALVTMHGGKLVVLALVGLALFGVLRGVQSFIRSSQEDISSAARGAAPRARPTSSAEADASQEDLTLALEAIQSGDWSMAEVRSSGVITRGAPDAVLARAHVVRGQARLQQNKPLAAVEDFTRVIDGFRNDETAYPEALLRRAQAHAHAGDPARAMADLDACIATHGFQGTLVEARLERGMLKKAAGDVDGARADLTWAKTFSLGRSPIGARARDLLTELGGEVDDAN